MGLAHPGSLLARHLARATRVSYIFRRATKVSSIIIPRRLKSRLKPLLFENRRLWKTLDWIASFDYRQCLARTYGRATPTEVKLLDSGRAGGIESPLSLEEPLVK